MPSISSKDTPIVVVEYSQQWPIQFEKEKTAIEQAIGEFIISVEHIGSTAVPGLGAKPIIDILIAIRSLVDAPQCIELLAQLAYQYIPEYEDELPERWYFRKVDLSGEHTHHIHMVGPDSEFWQRHILFRDYLRAHPEATRTYDRLKRELAEAYETDRHGYTEAKTEFIRNVEQQARAWSAQGKQHAT